MANIIKSIMLNNYNQDGKERAPLLYNQFILMCKLNYSLSLL